VRRFEFVEGKSAKFWQAEASGTTFIVEFGRLGTKGQRKEKDFPNEDAAKKELEKKIAEKLREGYSEVAAVSADAAAPDGAKGAQAASPKLELPTRFAEVKDKPTEQAISKAAAALGKLAASLGQRSFVVTQAHRRARNALAALGGVNPTDHPGLASELDRVLGLTTRSNGTRLSVGRSLELLYELPTPAFERAMAQWTDAKNPPPGIEWLAGEIETLGDAELAFRLGALLLDRPGRSMSSGAGWSRQLKQLLPHLEAHLARNNSSTRKHLAAMDSRGDTFLSARIAQATKMAGG
jgi:predicted DNA-binding WGR domain protein